MKLFGMIILFFLSACNPFKHPHQDEKAVDGFYTDAGDWDDSRIPLLKPYDMIRLKGETDWQIALQTPMISVAIHNVDKVNIIDSLIIVHSGETNLRGGVKAKEAWFVISPETQSEKGFAKKQDFEKELSSCHIGSAIFFEPNKIYSIFLKNKRIDWKIFPNYQIKHEE